MPELIRWCMATLANAKELIHAIDSTLSRAEIERIKLELLQVVDSLSPLTFSNVEPITHRRLSRREAEVMDMILSGKRLKEIAAVLDISVKTVTTHRSRLLRKLNLEDNLGLYRYGIRNGLIAV